MDIEDSKLSDPSSHPTVADNAQSSKETQIANQSSPAQVEPIEKFKPTRDFWFVMLAVCLSVLCAALDLTSVSVSLPTIVSELNSTGSFVWVTTSYSLVSTAFIPWSSGFATLFGRKNVLMFALVVFAVGSAVSGAAKNMEILIVGRSIMGLGAGFILILTDIIVADMVPLTERGLYLGLIGAVWAFASAIGPIIGAALSESGFGGWRWIFYLNLPVCGIALTLCVFFMKLKAPKTSFKEKLRRMDFLGNFFAIAGTASLIIGLTFGGTSYPWKSANVIVPIILGFLGLLAFVYIELYHVQEATIPFELLFGHRNSQVAAAHFFLQGVVFLPYIYFYPFYLQGSFGLAPIRTAVILLVSFLLIAFGAMAVGGSVNASGKFKPQNILGWVLTTAGIGSLLSLNENTSQAAYLGLQVIPALGIGMLFTAPIFSLLSPLAPQQNAPALAMMGFLRGWGNTIGLTIGAAVLNNKLDVELPKSFRDQLTGGIEVAYAAIAQVPGIQDEGLKQAVRKAYATSVYYIWVVLLPFAAIGLILCVFLKELALHTEMDDRYAVKSSKPILPSAEETGTETQAPHH